MFSEVLLNLVSDAIKFCGRGDSVTLFIPEGQNTTIAVKDTGVGINLALMAARFFFSALEPFFETKAELR